MPAVEMCDPTPTSPRHEPVGKVKRVSVLPGELKRLIQEAVEEAIDRRLNAILSPAVTQAISKKKEENF